MNLYRNFLKNLESEVEIIFVDDGSNDKSGYILDSIRAGNVKVFHTKNKGVSHARNYGMKNASGKYVMFVDVDDDISIHLLDYLKNTLNHHCKIVPDVCIYNRFIQNGTFGPKDDGDYFEEVWCKNPEAKENICSESKLDLMKNCIAPNPKYHCDFGGHVWGKAFRKQFLIDNRIYFNEAINICEDVQFSLEVMAKADCVIYSNVTNYYYNAMNENSLVHKYHADIFDIRKDIETMKEAEYSAYLPQLESELRISHLHALLSCFVYDFANRKNSNTLAELTKKIKQAVDYNIFSKALRETKIREIMALDNSSKEKIILLLCKIRCSHLLAMLCRFAARRK